MEGIKEHQGTMTKGLHIVFVSESVCPSTGCCSCSGCLRAHSEVTGFAGMTHADKCNKIQDNIIQCDKSQWSYNANKKGQDTNKVHTRTQHNAVQYHIRSYRPPSMRR